MAKVFNKRGTFTVTNVGVFPIKESIKNMTVKDPKSKYYGNQFNIDKTHTIAVKLAGLEVDGELYTKWITIGHRTLKDGDEECWRAEDTADGQWKTIYEQSVIECRYLVNPQGYVELNLKTLYIEEEGPRPAQVRIVGQKYNPNDGAASTGGSGGGGYSPEGAIKGNAFKCAMNILKGKIDSPKRKEIILACKELNEKLQKEFGLHGAVVGMCVQEACIHCTTIKKAEDWARTALSEVMGEVDDVWNGNMEVQNDPEPDPIVKDEVSDDDIPF